MSAVEQRMATMETQEKKRKTGETGEEEEKITLENLLCELQVAVAIFLTPNEASALGSTCRAMRATLRIYDKFVIPQLWRASQLPVDLCLALMSRDLFDNLMRDTCQICGGRNKLGLVLYPFCFNNTVDHNAFMYAHLACRKNLQNFACKLFFQSNDLREEKQELLRIARDAYLQLEECRIEVRSRFTFCAVEDLKVKKDEYVRARRKVLQLAMFTMHKFKEEKVVQLK